MLTALVSLIAAIIGGLFTAFISPLVTFRLNERARKIELYKTVYPEKFKAARDVMEKMSDLYATIIRKRSTTDPITLEEQVKD